MTRAELLSAIGYELNKNSTLDTATSNRLLSYLNQRHRRLLSAPGVQHLRDTVLTFASVADQPLYALPNVAKINRIWDITNNRVLQGLTLDEYRTIDPRATVDTGVSDFWVWAGYGATAKQPSDASELFVKSSSGSDTTQTARLECTITGNYPRTLSAALNGTTAVTFGSTVTTILNVSKFYISGTGAGSITLHEDSGSGTELARIGIGQTRQRYYQFYLWRTPADARTYTCDVTRDVTDLAQDTDEPMLPNDFHDLLVLGVVMDEYRHLDDTRYAAAAGELSRREREFKYWQHQTASDGPTVRERPSSLGAWYPTGT